MKNLFILPLIIGSFISCKSPEDERIEREYNFERKIDTLEMESFKIPDSLNTALIIASYYNPEFRINTFFVFTTAEKNSVQKIDYPPNGKASVESLEILKRNEYRSGTTQIDYVIGENSVSIIKVRLHGDPTMPNSLNYRRTDRD